MKKKFMCLLLGFLLVLPLVVAQETETNPGITPDMPMIYNLDIALERIRMAFTFGDENKVNYGLKVAEERLAEVKSMQEKNKVSSLEKARKGYENILERIENKTISEDVRIKVIEMTKRHTIEIKKVLTNAPEHAREGLHKAIEKSKMIGEKFK